MFYQIFLSPQVKRQAIITYKHGTYELANNLRIRILGNQEITGKCLSPIECQPSTQCPRQNEGFANTSRKFLKNRNNPSRCAPFHTITRASPKYAVSHCSPPLPDQTMENKWGLELVTSLASGCKHVHKIPFLVIFHLGNFDDLVQCGFKNYYLQLFQKLHSLICAKQIRTS